MSLLSLCIVYTGLGAEGSPRQLPAVVVKTQLVHAWVGVGGWGLGMGVYGSLAPPSSSGFSFVFWSVVLWPGVCGVGVGFWVRNLGGCVLEASAFGG